MHNVTNTSKAISVFLIGLLLSGCSSMELGNSSAKTVATGSASGANAQNANSALEKCDKSLGTLAIIEDTTAPWYGLLTGQYQLGSTVPILKLLVQQSNCFVIVDRGRAMNAVMEERALQESGELRNRSNFGKGQLVAADYSLSPSITFTNSNAGGVGAGAAGLLPGFLGTAVGALSSSINSKEASTMLTMIDNRSGVQIAAAEGSARATDFGAIGSLFGRSGAGSLGGYSNTAQGKVIVAAFTDSYNNVVRALRDYKQQTVAGGLGTGGHLKVQSDEGDAAGAAPKKAVRKKK